MTFDSDTENELLKSTEKYRIILESIEEGYYEVDLRGNLTFFNDAMARMNGYPPDEMMGMHSREYAASPKDVEHLNNEFIKVFNTGQSAKGIQYEIITKDGERKYLQTSSSLLKDSKGKPIGFKGIARDISELKKAQLALQESEERHRSIIKTSPDTIAFFDMNYKVEMMNPKGCKLFGYKDEKEIIGQYILKFIPKEDQDRVIHEFQNFLATNIPFNDELFLLKNDGKKFPAEIRTAITKDQEGRPTGFIILARDITKRRQDETFLKNSHERITLLINSISSILIAVSANNTIEFWNTEAERQFGFTEKEVLGRVIFEIAIPWDWRELAKEIEKCRKGKKSVRVDDLKFTQTSGKEGLLGIRLDNIFSREGSRRSILIQGANITNRKILESQLGQAQKLEAIGSLAAGIAHEINTPSQYVGDNTRFLKDAFGDLKAVMNQYERLLTTAKEGGDLSGLVSDVERIKKEKDLDYLMEDIPNAINQSLEGIERVTSIVQSVKEFSHPEQKEKTYIDINKSLESTITVARNEWKYVAEMDTIFDQDLPLLFCYPGELNQVLLNMIVNAAHAIEQAQRMDGERKGKIVLCTENQESHIIIKIKDNGSGIPSKIKEKIFDPFFTTKEVGKGTGQGLAISHSVIVEKHGGSIRVISEPGKGSEFIIELPKDVKTDTDDQTGGE